MVVSQEKLVERMYSKYKYALDMEDCYDIAEDILQACEENPLLMISLKEWMNGKTRFRDYIVNGFSLVDLAYRLDEKTPNVPVAILIIYLEETADTEYRALTVIAHQNCVCDKHLLKGELCKFAIRDDDVWYFLNIDQKVDDLRECQMWQVLLLNPRLIIQMTYEYDNGTTLILQEDNSYLIEIEADRKE